jgi:hypothetical protein
MASVFNKDLYKGKVVFVVRFLAGLPSPSSPTLISLFVHLIDHR